MQKPVKWRRQKPQSTLMLLIHAIKKFSLPNPSLPCVVLWIITPKTWHPLARILFLRKMQARMPVERLPSPAQVVSRVMHFAKGAVDMS